MQDTKSINLSEKTQEITQTKPSASIDEMTNKESDKIEIPIIRDKEKPKNIAGRKEILNADHFATIEPVNEDQLEDTENVSTVTFTHVCLILSDMYTYIVNLLWKM